MEDLSVRGWLVVLAVAIPIAGLAQAKAGPAEEKTRANGGVNWAAQVIEAIGSGPPDLNAVNVAQARVGAERAAQADAFRNLLAHARQIRISGGRTVGEEMETEEIRGKIESAIKAFKITRKRYYSDGGLEIEVEAPLSAFNEVFFSGRGSTGAVRTDGKAKNTGLVVDARGVSVEPALGPRLLDEAGHLLYAADLLSEEARKSWSVAAWVKSIAQAKRHERVGSTPLVVKVATAIGTDLVLAREDAKKLNAMNNAFLAEGRVVIVTR